MKQVLKQVNLSLRKGEIVGLVGESGSGKSTLAKVIMNLERVTSGHILWKGQSINGKYAKERQLYKQMQLVLQDSASSLYPGMSVGEIVEEPIRNYFPEINSREELCASLLERVGLDRSFLKRYPDQLSGGQKQRVCIAKALAVKPDLIIFDESIASLDSDSQQSMMRMLKRIQEQEEMTYLFITHDLASAQQLCDRIVVMYQGEIVDTVIRGSTERLKHPYSRLLFHMLEQDAVVEGC
jgi:ABC-type dipeptide/oligopeptide/nickel transport system ATPase subunit